LREPLVEIGALGPRDRRVCDVARKRVVEPEAVWTVGTRPHTVHDSRLREIAEMATGCRYLEPRAHLKNGRLAELAASNGRALKRCTRRRIESVEAAPEQRFDRRRNRSKRSVPVLPGVREQLLREQR